MIRALIKKIAKLIELLSFLTRTDVTVYVNGEKLIESINDNTNPFTERRSL